MFRYFRSKEINKILAKTKVIVAGVSSSTSESNEQILTRFDELSIARTARRNREIVRRS